MLSYGGFINEKQMSLFSDDEMEAMIIEPSIENAPEIEKNCLKFFRQLREAYPRKFDAKLFYRGFKKEDVDDGNKIFRRPKRTPKDTPKKWHDYSNEGFSDQFGWKVRDGVFVTSDKQQADNYGDTVYIFLPIGDFKFAWSDEIEDFYTQAINAGKTEVENNLKNEWDEDFGMNKSGTWFYNGLDVDENILIKAKDKIANNPEDYSVEFEINGKRQDFDSIRDTLLYKNCTWKPDITFLEYKEENFDIEMERFIDKMMEDYQDDDLQSALEIGHEVSFNSEQYFLINVHDKNDILDLIYPDQEL